MGVVNESVVAVSPRERLVPDTKVSVGHKLGSPVLTMLGFLPNGVVDTIRESRYGHEQRNALPSLHCSQGMSFFFLDRLFERRKATK